MSNEASHNRMSAEVRFKDAELVRSYALEGSEAAFATLVKQYAGLVYSTALRQTGDVHVAEEVAQVVFIILARKAAELPMEAILAGWLWRTTRFVALNLVRKEVRRRKTEQEAAASYQTETEAAWVSIAPLLDEALANLGEKDRNAVILRFLERKSLREIAAGLGTSEDAAQKRVSRALQKLRATFVKQGVVLSATVMAGAISAKSVEAAPSGLAITLARGALSGVGSATSVANPILKALQRGRRRALALRGGGVMLVALLAWLLVRRYGPGAPVTPPAGAPNVLSVAVPTAPPLPPPSVEPGPVALANAGRMRFVVLDGQTRRPVNNAQLSVYLGTRFPNITTNSLTTDREGQAVIDYELNAEDFWHLLIVIHKPGYVPKFVNWAAARGDLLEDIPATYTTTLERGLVAGGTVVDQDGQPIPDAKVIIDNGNPDVTDVTIGEREGLSLNHTESTDPRGIWTCDHLPAELSSLHFLLVHPDFLPVTYGCAKLGATTNLGVSYVAETDLLKRGATFRMQRGMVVAGIVVNTQGQALAGATVIKNSDWSNHFTSRVTDAQGRFRFGDVWPGQLVLTARAEGSLETDLVIQSSAPVENLCLALVPAATLRGRVLDERSNAVVRACISAIGESYRAGTRNWSTLSDTEGRFQWLSAPPLQTNYQISAPGYRAVNLALIPNGVEQQVVLQHCPMTKPSRIAGRVCEVKSGKPIEQFEVWVATTLAAHGPSHYPSPVQLSPKLRTTGTNGNFSFLALEMTADPVEELELEIKAEGYLPANRTISGPLTNRVWIESQLTPILAGTLQMPDGGAAAGAVVMLGEVEHRKMGYMRLPGQFDLQLSSAPHIQTDERGRFYLPAKVMAGILLAASPEGFTQVDLRGTTPPAVIRLQPWGRVVGMLHVCDRPGANRVVNLNNDYNNSDNPVPLMLARTVTTDAEGRFVMEGVPPGEWRLEPHHQCIRVRPGGTTDVQLGGGGLGLVGKIALQNPTRPDDQNRLRVSVNTKWFPIPTPTRRQFASFREYAVAKSRWLDQRLEFMKTPAGREARRDLRTYSANLLADGTFSIEEVLPGTYELSVSGDPLRFDSIEMSLLSDATAEVVVPEYKPGEAASLNVGVLQIDLSNR